MRKLVSASLVLVLALAPVRSSAQTSISALHQFSPTQTVIYLPFVVSVAGTFNLETFGTNSMDPKIWLFAEACLTGGCLGAALAVDDDSGTPSGIFFNSRITTPLGLGGYTLATSVYTFEEPDARAGSAGFDDFFDEFSTTCDDLDPIWTTCNYEVRITSEDGTATVVPEPGTLALLSTGLLGLVGIGRRRFRESEDEAV